MSHSTGKSNSSSTSDAQATPNDAISTQAEMAQETDLMRKSAGCSNPADRVAGGLLHASTTAYLIAPPLGGIATPVLCLSRLREKGEQQAAALEANLTNLENKLDALLASIEGGSAPSSEVANQGKTADSTGNQSEPGKET
ncbi:hypothetical protein F4810DRAFT_710792 [Camillea tinctor]|nr:hypothetical protein F4810DRAFT_710792 [Camillea tinctor]